MQKETSVIILLGQAIYLKGLGLLTDGGTSDLALKKGKKEKSLSVHKETPRCQH